jgi:predicted ABC-class ATPase
MLNPENLKKRLSSIDGQDYGKYQALLGHYDFASFQLIIQQIPKDPFAPPHTGIYRIQVRRSEQQFLRINLASKVQETAFKDYIARLFYAASKKIANRNRGTANSGLITINPPSQIIIERNNVLLTDELIEIRCFVGLPANGRKIASAIAEQMFMVELPEIIQQSLVTENIDLTELQTHINVAEDSDYLRGQLESLGLIGFIADGAILPRESSTSDKPLERPDAIEFRTPDSLTLEILLPHLGRIKGLGIKKGVCLIVGGGFHGKSTLLNALELGIYNHIPGDGREYCVSSDLTVKVRAYNGRNVINTDISPFINNLPFERKTSSFSSDNASGSTSQAASIIESIEVGAKVLLMDEDTCATNFMTRDLQMQQLIEKQDEPITAFIDRVESLYQQNKISTLLVLGSVGDYFLVADQVITMKNYEAYDMTEKAHLIATSNAAKRQVEGQGGAINTHARCPSAESINSVNEYGKTSLGARAIDRLIIGRNIIDLTDVEQLVEFSQTKTLAFAIEYSKRYMNKTATLKEVVEQVCYDVDEFGLDLLSDKIAADFAAFRKFELAFSLNRLRGLRVT